MKKVDKYGLKISSNLYEFINNEVFLNIDLNNEFLFYSRPKGTYKNDETEKILLDFYLVNTEISKNGNSVRVTINDSEFYIYEWSPYVISGLPKGETNIKLELLNKENQLIQTKFNPSSRTIILE